MHWCYAIYLAGDLLWLIFFHETQWTNLGSCCIHIFHSFSPINHILKDQRQVKHEMPRNLLESAHLYYKRQMGQCQHYKYYNTSVGMRAQIHMMYRLCKLYGQFQLLICNAIPKCEFNTLHRNCIVHSYPALTTNYLDIMSLLFTGSCFINITIVMMITW